MELLRFHLELLVRVDNNLILRVLHEKFLSLVMAISMINLVNDR